MDRFRTVHDDLRSDVRALEGQKGCRFGRRHESGDAHILNDADDCSGEGVSRDATTVRAGEPYRAIHWAVVGPKLFRQSLVDENLVHISTQVARGKVRSSNNSGSHRVK